MPSTSKQMSRQVVPNAWNPNGAQCNVLLHTTIFIPICLFRKPAEWLKDESVKDIDSPYLDSITKFAKVGSLKICLLIHTLWVDSIFVV